MFGDLVFVVERDNHRVQVMELPDFVPLATFGEAELLKPYGLWLRELAPLELEVLVTDSYQTADNSVPPRVKAMSFRSFESVKFAASLSGPYRAGRGGFAVGLTV